jgi:RsiW-degrading membrane proteinase PrsW (M82 family)
VQPGNLGSALVFGVVPAIGVIGLVYALDRYEKEPVRLLAAAVGFGAILAPAGAVLIERLLAIPTSVVVQTAVPYARLNPTTPIVEEAVRAAAILAVMWLVRREVDTLLDGLVYGAAVGAGFGMTVTFFAILTSHPFGDADLTGSLFVTTVASLNHTFYGALIGLIVAAARRRRATGQAAAAALGGAVAAGAHLLHDYLPAWVASDPGSIAGGSGAALVDDLLNLLGLVALAVLVAWASGREALLVEHELRDEVAAGVVTPAEYAVVTRPGRRFAALARALLAADDWRHRRRLYALEIELAFRKAYRRSGRPVVGGLLTEEAYRAGIARTRRELADAEAGPR